ncbi:MULTISPECIES: DUF6233 domain-containing protein [unclassified Streptomyces]|uniref:DUF6233 domain-containing protein n=1 Tax=unclassified Streptomyces TaxID=2593676 RepID=UPI003CE7CF83
MRTTRGCNTSRPSATRTGCSPSARQSHALRPTGEGTLHTGECWDPGKRAKNATRKQAVEVLRQQVPARTKRRPDTVFGIVARRCEVRARPCEERGPGAVQSPDRGPREGP